MRPCRVSKTSFQGLTKGHDVSRWLSLCNRSRCESKLRRRCHEEWHWYEASALAERLPELLRPRSPCISFDRPILAAFSAAVPWQPGRHCGHRLWLHRQLPACSSELQPAHAFPASMYCNLPLQWMLGISWCSCPRSACHRRVCHWGMCQPAFWTSCCPSSEACAGIASSNNCCSSQTV